MKKLLIESEAQYSLWCEELLSLRELEERDELPMIAEFRLRVVRNAVRDYEKVNGREH